MIRICLDEQNRIKTGKWVVLGTIHFLAAAVMIAAGVSLVLQARFDIRSIPVQVFFDRNGKEVFRHNGFFPEAEVHKQLKQMSVE